MVCPLPLQSENIINHSPFLCLFCNIHWFYLFKYAFIIEFIYYIVISYQTDNGIHHEEEEDNNGYVKGRYTYKSPEGQLIDLKYEADVNGFRPSGIHLPTSPPIPDAFFLAIRLHELASGNGIEKPPLFYS